MGTRSEFKKLEERVALIEVILKIQPHHNLVTLKQDVINVAIEDKLHTENYTTIKPTPELYTFLKTHDDSSCNVFVRIFLHGLTDIQPNISTLTDRGYFHYLYVKPYYSVLIVKNIVSYHDWSTHNLNTIGTTNTSNYATTDKRVALYFGYANQDTALPNNNLFIDGRESGVFFIINDKVHKRVQPYVSARSSEIDLIRKGLTDGNIDIYKSKLLIGTVNVSILSSTTATPRSSHHDEDAYLDRS